MSKLLQIYHQLPSFGRTIAASTHGLNLRRWRYGSETDLLVAEALQREQWPLDKWQEWQQSKLSHLLRRASKSVPHYRNAWRPGSSQGNGCSSLALENWPILSKQNVRQNPRDFVAEDVSLRRLRLEQTSGTTGTPLRLWHSRNAAMQWYALMEARWRTWYGVSRHDVWGILGGQLVAPFTQNKPPFWVWNAGLKQLYLSSYHLTEETCASYLAALRERRVVYLWGYASSLYSLALFAREQRLEPPQFKVIVSNAELLPDHEREVISAVFRCPVRNTYGMCEMVAAAGECEHGRLHLWPEAGILEVFDDERDEPAPIGTVGRLVCTGLINSDMPLVRYEVGDRGALADPVDCCPCGRTLPTLLSLEGRREDVILTPDRRRIGRLDPVFKANLPIREAQVIQETLKSLVVRVVPTAAFTSAAADQIVKAIKERVGTMSVRLECLDCIPRGENGKFRGIISLISPATFQASGSRAPDPRGVRAGAPFLLKAFHTLPPFARNWAASVHGYSLRSSRYSSVTSRLTEAALERDRWSAANWRSWQEERLAGMFRRAALEVPFYRDAWERRRRQGDEASFEDLANWPILKKEILRSQSETFVASDCDRRKMEVVTTSGTTGVPVTLWRSRETNQEWYALNEARVRRWNGVSHLDRWGHLGGQPVVPFHQPRPPYWVWNSALKQLYLSCMHIGPHSSAAYLSAIEEYRLDYLLGYSSSIAMLAHAAIETGVHVPLSLVVTDSEPLLQNQRSTIEKGFGCPVRETYGLSEIACAASECSSGNLHIWPEVGIIELLDENDQPVAPGQTGRIVATQLLNPDMPLIRYDTQDLAQANPDESPCPCGRTLPRIRKLLGRNDDVVITRDGRRIVQIDRIFDPRFDIRSAQIVQEAIGSFRIKVVPGKQWSKTSETALCEALHNLVGEAQIRVDLVSEIERTWAGKHRMIISKVSATSQNDPKIQC